MATKKDLGQKIVRLAAEIDTMKDRLVDLVAELDKAANPPKPGTSQDGYVRQRALPGGMVEVEMLLDPEVADRTMRIYELTRKALSERGESGL